MVSVQCKTVLIVDDQSTARRALRHMLECAGYRVVEAESGEQALELAAGSAFDAVVLDVKMPGIGGILTCRRLRATERHRITPILMVTAMDERQALADAFAAGCDDFIPKPIEPVVLEVRLHSHLQRAELYFQLERVRRNLNRYLSPRTRRIAEQYSESGMLPAPHQVDVCVLFTDIRGFTQLSQDIKAEQLFALLSGQLAFQVDLVYGHGGYVDKYAGDGIMAVFEGEGRALRASLCALDVIAHARETSRDMQQQLFAVGCGIHQGPAVIGNIGSPEHLDYSVIGESVNLAARLCGFADPMSIIVSDSVQLAVQADSRLCFCHPRRVAVKGFRQPVAVYELRSAS
jgi:class 3 adenylate cyclase/CheY-like chemotaxis protein